VGHIDIQNKTKLKVKWIELKPHILEMLGSNLGLVSDSSESDFP
jgi:hypothetical protein